MLQQGSNVSSSTTASPISSAKKGKQKIRSKFIQSSPIGANTVTLDTIPTPTDSPFIKGKNTNAKKLIQNVTEKVDEIDTTNTPRKTIKNLTSYPESPSTSSISALSVTPLSIFTTSNTDTSILGAESPLLSSTPQQSTVTNEPLDNATPEDAVKKLKELAFQMQQKQKELEQAELKLNQVITNYEQQQQKQGEIKETLDKVYHKLEQDKLKFSHLIQTLTEAEPKDEAIQRLQVQVQDFETQLHTRMHTVVVPSKEPNLVFLGSIFLLSSLIIFVLLNIISNAIASKQGGILLPS